MSSKNLTELPPPDLLKRAFLEGLEGNDASKMEFSLPLYSLSLKELRDDPDPLRPKPLGWQFLTIDAKGVTLAGEVPNEPDEPDGKVTTSLTRGMPIEEAWKAYREVIQHPEVLSQRFELRRLRISSLRIEAFWLKMLPADETMGPTDRVWAFVAFQEELKSKLVSVPAFLSVVRKLAEQAVATNAPRARPSGKLKNV
jgi:hypothetical protein